MECPECFTLGLQYSVGCHVCRELSADACLEISPVRSDAEPVKKVWFMSVDGRKIVWTSGRIMVLELFLWELLETQHQKGEENKSVTSVCLLFFLCQTVVGRSRKPLRNCQRENRRRKQKPKDEKKPYSSTCCSYSWKNCGECGRTNYCWGKTNGRKDCPVHLRTEFCRSRHCLISSRQFPCDWFVISLCVWCPFLSQKFLNCLHILPKIDKEITEL